MAYDHRICIGCGHMRIDVVMNEAFAIGPALIVIFRVLSHCNLIMDNLDVIVTELLCRFNLRINGELFPWMDSCNQCYAFCGIFISGNSNFNSSDTRIAKGCVFYLIVILSFKKYGSTNNYQSQYYDNYFSVSFHVFTFKSIIKINF